MEDYERKLEELCQQLSTFNDSSLAFELRLRQHLLATYEAPEVEPRIITDTVATYLRLGLNGRGRAIGSGSADSKRTRRSSRTTQSSSESCASSPDATTVGTLRLSQITGRTRRSYRHPSTSTGDLRVTISPPECSCEGTDFCEHCYKQKRGQE